MSTTRRILTGVLTVLAIAAIGFVVRGALGGDGKKTPDLPKIAGQPSKAKPQADDYTLSDLARNIIPKGAVTIATARTRVVQVYEKPKGKHSKALKQRVFNGQRIPLTFLVRSRRKGWVRVDLPTRPNQSTGWVRRHAVRLSFTKLSIVIKRKAHVLHVLDGKKTILTKKIAVGESVSPTPPGRYFVTDVIRATDPKGFYGPYALGLSAHSTVYSSFEGGDGQVGIHGTNAPGALGTDVSHGCIRVGNAVVSKLAKTIPLGTPVLIER